MIFIASIMMVVTFAVTIALNLFKVQDTGCAENKRGIEMCCPNNPLTIYQIESDVFLDKPDDEYKFYLGCFCSTQDKQEVLYEDQELYNLCFETVAQQQLQVFLNIAAGVVVCIVNVILTYTIVFLVEIQRYATQSEFTAKVTKYSSYILFINTAIIPVFSSVRYGKIIFAKEIALYFPGILHEKAQEQKLESYYEDFNRIFYMGLGQMVIATMVMNIMQMGVPILTTMPSRCLGRKYKTQEQVEKAGIMQYHLNKLYKNPVFDIKAHYAMAVNVIFVTMFFCSGMPILLGLSAFFFWGKYIVDKYMLLRYNSKPPAFDEKIALEVAEILPYTIDLHLLMAIMMYGCEEIFPVLMRIKESQDQSVVGLHAETQFIEDPMYQKKLMRVFLCAGLWLVWRGWLTFKDVIWDVFCGGEFELSIEHMASVFDKQQEISQQTYDEVRQKLAIADINSYKMENNQDYTQLCKSMSIKVKAKQTKNKSGMMSNLLLTSQVSKVNQSQFYKIPVQPNGSQLQNSQAQQQQSQKLIKVQQHSQQQSRQGYPMQKVQAQQAQGQSTLPSKLQKQGNNIIDQLEEIRSEGNVEDLQQIEDEDEDEAVDLFGEDSSDEDENPEANYNQEAKVGNVKNVEEEILEKPQVNDNNNEELNSEELLKSSLINSEDYLKSSMRDVIDEQEQTVQVKSPDKELVIQEVEDM